MADDRVRCVKQKMALVKKELTAARRVLRAVESRVATAQGRVAAAKARKTKKKSCRRGRAGAYGDDHDDELKEGDDGRDDVPDDVPPPPPMARGRRFWPRADPHAPPVAIPPVGPIGDGMPAVGLLDDAPPMPAGPPVLRRYDAQIG